MLRFQLLVYGLAGLMMLGGCAHWTGEEIWVRAEDYEDVHVVVGPEATQADQRAARQFAEYWRRTTGFMPLVAIQPDPDQINVWVGAQGMPESLRNELEWEGMAPEAVYIKTVAEGAHGRPALLLAGGSDTATLNAVYHFFERAMGVKWVSPSEPEVPEQPPASIEMIDLRYDPVYEYGWGDDGQR